MEGGKVVERGRGSKIVVMRERNENGQGVAAPREAS
jgi:hypothetical protein